MFYSNGAYSLFKVDTPVISGGATPPSFQDIYSYQFDGIDDFIRVNDADNLSFGNASTDSAFSISAWVKMTDATRFRIVSKMTDSSNMEYAFFTSAADQLYFALYDVTSSNRISRFTSSTLTSYEGQWVHLVATYSGSGISGGLKIYLDNARIDNTDSNVGSYTAMHNLSVSFKIGKYDTSTSNGLIDEVAVFNSELSASDVTAIYNGGIPTSLSSYSSLVSWWRMGESASWDGSNWTLTDQGSGGNNATTQNMAEASRVLDVPPNPFANTKSILLDGVDDYVKVGTSSLGITTAITISAWVKTAFSGSNQYIIAEDPRATGKRNWLLQIRADGKFQCVIWSSNGSSLTSSTTPLTYNNGQWHNVIATFDGTTNANGLKIYVDGTLASQSTASVSGIFSSSSSEPIIGGDSTSPTLPFNGNLDEIAVWNSDQSANASAIYNSGVPNDISSLSPLSWWRCGDGDTAPILSDNGSGGNDGTMTNFTTFSTDVPT